MAIGLRIHDLGPLEASNSDGPVALGTRKERQLLAVLIMEPGGVVSSDRLIDCLWGDNAPSKPLVSLRSYASNLRKALGTAPDGGAYLDSETGSYSLRVASDNIDSARFENTIAEARAVLGRAGDAAPLLDEALVLVRGTPLADMVYEDFAQQEIGRLTELIVTAQELRARLAIDTGDSAAWLARIADMVASLPLREGIRALHMEALYHTGRQAEALRSYKDHRELLVEELGIDPSPELQSLEARILTQELPAPSVDVTKANETTSTAGRTGEVPRANRQERLVGRDRELAALAALAAAAPGAAVIVGPSGSGKSAVMARFVDQMSEQGWRVAQGMCHDDDGVPPLWPWREVLRDLDAAGSVTISASDEFDRFELFDDLVSELLGVARREKIIIALEDLQWADADSLTLLSMIIRRARSESFVVVATSRSAEIALPTASCTWVEINPLDTPAIVELVESVTEMECSEDLAKQLSERTGGNAYFVTEIARLARQSHRPVAADDQLPAHFAGLVGRRLEGLGAATIELLGWAALELQNFSLDLLASVTKQSVDLALAALQPALDAGLIKPDRSAYARYRFDHDITRESVAALVDPMVVAERHAALGEAMEASPNSTNDAALLSRHFSLAIPAGAAAAAARWATQAATEATATGSYGEALVHLRRAIDAHRADPNCDQEAFCRALISIGESSRVTGDAAEGQEALFEAFRLAEKAADRELMGAAALSLAVGLGTGRYRFWWDPGPAALEALRVAAKAAGDNLPLKAQLLAQLGSDSYGSKPEEERFALAEEAVMLARNSGDESAIASVLLTESGVSSWSWDPERRHNQAMEVLEIAQRLGLEDIELRTHQYLIGDAIRSSAIDDAVYWFDHLQSRANLVGSVNWRFSVTQWSLLFGHIRGDWDHVHRLATEALDPVQGYGDYFATAIRTQQTAVRMLQGDTDETEAFFRQMMTVTTSPTFPRILLWVLALNGREDESLELLGRVDFTTKDADVIGGVFSFALLAEALAELGQADLLPPLLERLRKGREQPIIALSGRGGMTYLGPTRYYLGRALIALGLYDEAEQELQLGRQTTVALQSPPFILQSDFALALLTKARDGAEPGAAALGAVRDRAIALGMKSFASMAERALAAASNPIAE